MTNEATAIETTRSGKPVGPNSLDSKPLNPMAKLGLDLGPLVLFFITNAFAEKWFGLTEIQRVVAATAVFVVATLISLAIGYAMTRKFSAMSILTAVIVIVFGGLKLLNIHAISPPRIADCSIIRISSGPAN